jgi:hypothetical protein
VGDTNNTAGTIAFNVTVPATATTNPTFARFRWSTTMGLDAVAAAANGEVEDYSITLVPAATTFTIAGTLFDDVNYGGGAGRAFGSAGTTGVSSARVELYSSTGTFISNTTTAAGGTYSFANLANGNYYVRVVNTTVKSTRSGSDGTERGIQTYRTNGTTAVINEVGGRKPASTDAAANTTSQTLNTTTFLLSGGGQAQSVQPITVAGSNISGANFGFNFSTVVNTNDSGQGSLRQGITNINLLANTGLAQAGQDNTYGVNTSVTKEVLLFNIPAASDPLGRADICGGATCKITVNSQLPAVAKQPAIIDATTQPGYVAGTPGVPRIHIVPAAGVSATGLIMDYDAPDSTLRGIAISGFRNIANNNSVTFDRGLTVNSERTLVESSYIGVTPAGTADGNGYGIQLQWTQSAVIGGTTAAKRNIVSANLYLGVFFDTGAAGGIIQNNFIGTNPAGTVAMGNGSTGIDTEAGAGPQILDNIIAGNGSNGIELGSSSGGGVANAIIQNNRIGVGANGAAIGNGVGIMNYGGSSGHLIEKNIIGYNLAGGIKMANTNVTGVVISQNAIYANGGLGVDLGNNGVTVNDANDADTGANDLLNFPILSQLTLAGSNLTITGCAPAGASVELFEADVSAGGKATPGDNKQGKSKDYGEGQTYLTSFVEGSASDTDSADCALATDADGNDQSGMKAFSVTIAAPAAFVIGDTLTATATLTGIGTSEFSPVIRLLEVHDIAGAVFEDVNYGGGAGRAFNTVAYPGMKGVTGATVELYDTSNTLISSTTTVAGGAYAFTNIPVGVYNVKVVGDTVSSTRTGSNGSELGIMTYRTDGTVAGEKTNDVGGQTLQPITLAATNLSNVNFGFNFDTVTNTNDAGQGSLRQFLLNANLLGGDSTLAQNGLVSSKENAIILLPTTDPNYNPTDKYWSIPLLSTLPAITSPVVLDGSMPPGSNSQPVLELNGKGAGAGINGLTLAAGSNGSTIRNLSINRFGGAGVYVNVSNTNTLQANRIGTDPTGTKARANVGAGILLNTASNNLVGGTNSSTGNLIANNGGAGVAVTGSTSVANTIIGNSIHSNDKLGIDLDNDGVTINDLLDADTGPNQLLNYPEVQAASFSTNGSRIIT